MVCQTVKEGTECVFMSKRGCSYNGGKCHPIVDNCNGCDRVTKYPTGLYCKAYSEPALKWIKGHCTLATNVKRNNGTTEEKKLNPLKASKRKSRNK
ncbi:MAG: PxxKW family cysteine-rich protein [Syntrophobacterales bacterium]|nr:MAG: PxxKW family cysteine-rich protein [Syntrophobacterales bacterium]